MHTNRHSRILVLAIIGYRGIFSLSIKDSMQESSVEIKYVV
jgi:hypothetical protein